MALENVDVEEVSVSTERGSLVFPRGDGSADTQTLEWSLDQGSV